MAVDGGLSVRSAGKNFNYPPVGTLAHSRAYLNTAKVFTYASFIVRCRRFDWHVRLFRAVQPTILLSLGTNYIIREECSVACEADDKVLPHHFSPLSCFTSRVGEKFIPREHSRDRKNR